MSHGKPPPPADELLRELQALRAENLALARERDALRVDALRFRALIGSGNLSLSVSDMRGRNVELSPGWERMWGIPRDAFLRSGYSIFDDAQLAESGVLDSILPAYRGEEIVQPPIAYDPQQTASVEAGERKEWVIAVALPVFDEQRRQVEALMWQYTSPDVVALQREHRALEASLRDKNHELEQQIARIEAQKDAIQALSAPVLRVDAGVLVLPIIGVVDDARGALLLETLLAAVAAQRAAHVIVDVTGLAAMDAGAAGHLTRMVRAARLLGAECVLAGITPGVARTLTELDVGLDDVQTSATLADGLARVRRREDPRRAGP